MASAYACDASRASSHRKPRARRMIPMVTADEKESERARAEADRHFPRVSAPQPGDAERRGDHPRSLTFIVYISAAEQERRRHRDHERKEIEAEKVRVQITERSGPQRKL